MAFQRDPNHWLFKFAPAEWIRAAMAELRRAEAAYKQRNARAGLAGCRRAGGMALNAALVVEPNEGWGRTYVDHLLALSQDESAPEAVRAACKLLLDTQPPGQNLISLRTATVEEKLLEGTRDIIAH